MIQRDYIKRTYAGWLGKVIGIRMGAPIEGWQREKIELFYGKEMKDYVVDYKDFAADDDSNGPIFFIRGLEHYKNLSAREMGYTCLNYIAKEHGFFWWGGELSTEHTAFKNLFAGMEAPESGSAKVNGMEMAEQIGGQIFIDGFGFVAPGKPELACQLAEASARVTHDFDGVAGARFIAACIALAYVKSDIKEIMEEALTFISKDGNYYKVVKEMMDYYEAGKSSDEAYQCLRDKYWIDCYKGVCHIIPNAGIIAIALLYGEGNYLKTMELVNLLGFDTDCNAGNVGAILGVICGTYEENETDGIPKYLITPIKDIMIASSVVGSLNISTLSENTLLFCKIGYELAGEEMPEPFKRIWDGLEKEVKRISHFEFTDAIHGFRIKGNYKNAELSVVTTDEDAYLGERCLKARINNIHPGNQVYIYQKTYYEPEDLHDARYQPCFSPIAYTGDQVSCQIKNVTGQKLMAYLYCYDTVSGEKYRFASAEISRQGDSSKWISLAGQIPTIPNARIKEVGIEIVSTEPEDIYFGEQVILYIDEFVIQGKPNLSIDFSTLYLEDYSLHSTVQKELSGFTHYQGNIDGIQCTKEGVELSREERIFTGDYYWRDYSCTLRFAMKEGKRFDFLLRAQGNLRSYGVQIADNELRIVCNAENKETVLAKASFVPELEKEYLLSTTVKGSTLQIALGEITLSVEDATYEYGMIGMQIDESSVVLLKDMKIESKL
ncbi:ADP-ribosylglycohydrolase family protein [Clostridium sp. Marseille-P299]|uniref:ADP-ribosylglycohydrolase family protein n=1 Tax=Clostridium sp. Marseille-P299 TaxID=1805477 RepID=UPI000830B7D0|nr:ADP-ribosylglycohydrolase family protein [Clostridium sp. Marseille-P299]